MIPFLFPILLTGCLDYKFGGDSLSGTWEGDLTCGGQDYSVVSIIKENESYEYTGQMLFKYEKEVSGGVFKANILYDFTVVQGSAAGKQNLFFDMTWTDLGCLTEYDDGSTENGGCVANGLNTEDFVSDCDSEDSSSDNDCTDIGDVQFYFDGGDRIAIGNLVNDDHCSGILYRE